MRVRNAKPRPGIYRFSVLVLEPEVFAVLDPILPEITYAFGYHILADLWQSWHRVTLDTLHVTTEPIEDVLESEHARQVVTLHHALNELQRRIDANERSDQRWTTRVIRR